MKTYIKILTLLFSVGVVLSSEAINVTFQVNMSREQGVSSVSLAGDFQGWDPSTNVMTNIGGGIYSITVALPASSSIAYRFVKNGYMWEQPVGACASSFTRNRTLPAVNTMLAVECFNNCGSCAVTPARNVTFKVDMSSQTVSASGVHLVGNFQGWNPSSTSMTNIGAGIYSVTLPFFTGSLPVEYKFLNGNAWGTEEVVSGSCQTGTNRNFIPPVADSTLGVVCFGYCTSTCLPVVKVACVGNSITYGAGVPNPATQSYPAQLGQLLGSNYAVGNYGHSGATMLKNGDLPYWNQLEYTNAKASNPDIVVIELGTNDSKSWNWGPFGGQYTGDYDAMIDAFRALPSNPKIFICMQPKAFSTAYAIDETVLAGQIRPDVWQVAKDKGVNIIDNYDASKNDAVDYPDGIHPNIAGSGILAAKVQQLITAASPVFTRSVDTLIAPSGNAYQWYLNGDTIPAASGGTNKKLTIHATGNYSLGLKLNNYNQDRLISASISETPGALPVQLLYFNAYKEQEEKVVLEWKTASEINNKEFEIQKSIDGNTFYTISFIAADQTGKFYSFTDSHFHSDLKNTYYRLKQVDDNGSFTYSVVVVVASSENSSPTHCFYPNPIVLPGALSVNYFSVLAEQANLKIMDISGKEIKLIPLKSIKGLNSHSIELSGIGRGVYIITLILHNKEYKSKIMINE